MCMNGKMVWSAEEMRDEGKPMTNKTPAGDARYLVNIFLPLLFIWFIILQSVANLIWFNCLILLIPTDSLYSVSFMCQREKNILESY